MKKLGQTDESIPVTQIVRSLFRDSRDGARNQRSWARRRSRRLGQCSHGGLGFDFGGEIQRRTTMNCDGETATAVFVLQRSTIPTRGDHGVVVRIKLSCGLKWADKVTIQQSAWQLYGLFFSLWILKFQKEPMMMMMIENNFVWSMWKLKKLFYTTMILIIKKKFLLRREKGRSGILHLLSMCKELIKVSEEKKVTYSEILKRKSVPQCNTF